MGMMGNMKITHTLHMLGALVVAAIASSGAPAQDTRMTLERHTDTVFAMTSFESLEEWESYADRLRKRIRISSGLYPWPQRTPLNAQIFDRTEYDGYSVEKVYFEAYPGFLVTGNLYRPLTPGPHPGVLNPHGHWEHGRLEDSESGSVPARCITFARMGMVALSIDMLGYNDSRQFEHKWSEPELALWGIHPFGLQLWSGVRALDLLASLPDVDPNRLGVTGASGGGTQTFALTAIDERVKVAAPVNMISSTMQGGCVCENAPLIRIDASNMEIGALAAPRPMLMVSATGDWTRLTPEVEYPAIRSIYELYGAADQLEQVQIDAPHNFNLPSREAVYRFFGKHLLGDGASWADFTEPAYEMPPLEALRVFPEGGPLPEVAASREQVIANIKTLLVAAVRDMLADPSQIEPDLMAIALGVDVPKPAEVAGEVVESTPEAQLTLEDHQITWAGTGAVVPIKIHRPASVSKATLLYLYRPLAGVEGVMTDELRAVINEASGLVATLELPTPDLSTIPNSSFRDTFHPTPTAHQIQDVTIALAYLRQMSGSETYLIGLEGCSSLALLAAAVAPDLVTSVTVDVDALPANDADWVSRAYVPGLRGIGGVATAAAILGADAVRLLASDRNDVVGQTAFVNAWPDLPDPTNGSATTITEAPPTP